ncbi:MAG: copper homeostasis protein CutC [Weeksellaceae bacterium]|jgi:copper homeostasis protein|nr:copper homeostasis protein CutC [Weeksellaceae bacterium]
MILKVVIFITFKTILLLVEICTSSLHSLLNAERAGAHRAEFCSELAVGGITPSYGLLKEAIERTSLPLFVLIRPRSGNFVYSDFEFETMKTDIEICKKMGYKGIVSGVLTLDNRIDKERTKELIEISKPLEFTFHRAFDLTNDAFQSLEELIELGVSRILTSGQASSAEKGLNLLIQLKKLTGNKLTILPGGGITPENVHLFKKNGFMEIHASASSLFKEVSKPKIPMNSEIFFDETKIFLSDEEIIKRLLEG